MANKLIVELRGPSVPDDPDAPLTQEEAGRVESVLRAALEGTTQTTNDPEERDRGIAEAQAAGRHHVMVYRAEA